jgi:hypothetical protein
MQASPIVLVTSVMRLTCIQEVPRLDIGRVTETFSEAVRVLLNPVRQMSETYPKIGRDYLVPDPFRSLIHSYPNIRCCKGVR